MATGHIHPPNRNRSIEEWADAAWESFTRSYNRRHKEAYAPLFSPFLKFTVLVFAVLTVTLLVITYGGTIR